MRAFLVVLALIVGMLPVGCKDPSSPDPTANQAPLVISKEVWAYYQKYLNTGSPLAFAVSSNGRCANYSYCSGGHNCQQYNEARSWALNNCSTFCHDQCVVFAKWSQIVVPYEIASY